MPYQEGLEIGRGLGFFILKKFILAQSALWHHCIRWLSEEQQRIEE